MTEQTHRFRLCPDSADLERFTTFDIAEVRVSKGFASVLYGPNALGGAINIVSRRPADRLEGEAGASYGSGASRILYLNAAPSTIPTTTRCTAMTMPPTRPR